MAEFKVRSKSSAAKALESLLRQAVDRAPGGGHTHIIVKDIEKFESGWEVTADIVSRHKKRMQQEDALEDHPKKKVRSPDLRHKKSKREQDEEEKKKKKERDFEYEHHMEANLALIEEVEHQRVLDYQRSEETFHLYMHIAEETLFHEVAPQFNFAHVHFLEGPLWEEANRDFPVLDFYDVSPRDGGAPKVSGGDSGPQKKRRPSRELELTEELED